MTQGVVATHPHESLTDVAERMRAHGVGAVAIMEGDKLIGIVTERDLARATVDGLSPRVTPAGRYMTPSPVTISPEADASEAATLMSAHRVRHLPVVEERKVIGFLSARDILRVQDRCGDLADLAYEPW
jgi:CBS domain-containing protein